MLISFYASFIFLNPQSIPVIFLRLFITLSDLITGIDAGSRNGLFQRATYYTSTQKPACQWLDCFVKQLGYFTLYKPLVSPFSKGGLRGIFFVKFRKSLSISPFTKGREIDYSVVFPSNSSVVSACASSFVI